MQDINLGTVLFHSNQMDYGPDAACTNIKAASPALPALPGSPTG